VGNAVFNALRKRAIRRAYLIKGISNPESVTDPYVQIFNNDLKDRLDDMISYLPPKQQLILNYRRQEGLSSEEIAKKLNLSVRTVDNQIYKATKRLKDFFRSETE
jgi:RNA polymerase sigma-70 factor (ECF subfamily)